MPKMLIGFSLSFCVFDILNGKVREDEVLLIVSNTLTETEEQWQRVMDVYASGYWIRNPKEGIAIANRLREKSKLVEHRRYEKDTKPYWWLQEFSIADGWWTEVDPNN